MKANKIERVALSGGILGAILTNPKAAIDRALVRANTDGWYCRQVMPHSTSNIFILMLQAFVLVCTLGLWTFGAGYLLLLEKDSQ